MKKILAASVIFLFTQFASAATGCEDLVINGALPQAAKQDILCKTGFVIGYSQDRKGPFWVAEKLTPDIVKNLTIKKRIPFHKDPSVPDANQPAASDFAHSGFDTGHMVSFDDMAYSTQSAADSMSLTNVVPQNPNNNRGAWKSLESFARKLAVDRTVYVVSGPIYESSTTTIDHTTTPVPTKLYKIIIDPAAGTSRTYVLPNEAVPHADIPKYVTTRAEVQKLIGFDPTPGAKLTDILR